MAYENHQHDGRTTGKLLYQLSAIGIPLHFVDSAVFHPELDQLWYRSSLFASYKWNERDEPIFTFHNNHAVLNSVGQNEIFTVWMSTDDGKTKQLMHSFSDRNHTRIGPKSPGVFYYVYNKDDVLVDMNFNPIKMTPIGDHVSALAKHFGKVKR